MVGICNSTAGSVEHFERLKFIGQENIVDKTVTWIIGFPESLSTTRMLRRIIVINKIEISAVKTSTTLLKDIVYLIRNSCLLFSNKTKAVATLTFSEATPLVIGILANKSHSF